MSSVRLASILLLGVSFGPAAPAPPQSIVKVTGTQGQWAPARFRVQNEVTK